PLSPLLFSFPSRRRHTRSKRDWSSAVCSSDLHSLALLPLLDLDRARVPDLDCAPAILSGGDLPRETRVFPRVVLGPDGESVLFFVQRWPFGNGPRDEHPAPLEAEVPVQPARVVALDHEDRLISSWGLTAREWFGGALGVAFRAVGRKRGVARSVLVL